MFLFDLNWILLGYVYLSMLGYVHSFISTVVYTISLLTNEHKQTEHEQENALGLIVNICSVRLEAYLDQLPPYLYYKMQKWFFYLVILKI